MILENFASEMNQQAKIEHIVSAVDTVTGRVTETSVDKITVTSAYYVGRSAQNLVSEKFRTEVDGVFIIDPSELSNYKISTDDVITINDVKHNVIFADDIMFQGEILSIGVKLQ